MLQIQKLIRNRHSERGAFDTTRTVAKPELELILEAARWAPTPNNMQNFEIVVVDDRRELEAIGKIPAYMSEPYLRENYAQLSFSEAELETKKVGMPASAFPAAWTNPEAWSQDSDYRSQLTFLDRTVRDPSLLLVVLYDGSKRAPGSDGDVLGHMGLGCVLENMWLMSEALGIGFHVLTIFNDTLVDREVKKIIHAEPPMKIAFACALGYPVTPSAADSRVRRNLEDFVHHNQFGRKDVRWKEHRH
ncbi:MAG TPA: nitroreductase family protein [Acidobacteriaceae bacterium]|nr:nitroreductase family protein [Acidobacteriaceae bacterium]